MRRATLAGILLLALGAGGSTAAQERQPGFETPPRADPKNNIPYDGRFVFARIMYQSRPSGFDQFRRPDIHWDHDYPRAERHFTRILQQITLLLPFTEGGNIFALDDPELHKYPIAYMAEPGFWTMSDQEMVGLRSYLLKGGFIIFDDFAANQWFNFERQLRRVLPDAQLVRLDKSHPIFDTFYRIESLEYNHPYFNVPSEFYGVFENNDPSRRLLTIVNYNNDISEYWEWSDMGLFPVELSNEAYKLGVNYILYGMTR
jgi:Domain of unknown function (DUF4159)